MKKIIFRVGLVVILCSFVLPAFAERLHVQALSEFSTDNPSEYIIFRALDSIELSPEVKICEGYAVEAKVTEIIPPKRLKRNASFRIVPVKYADVQGNTYNITEEFVGKFSPRFDLDKTKLVKNAALGVGSYFVKGLSLGYHALEGAVKNEEGNRAKSSVVSVYKNSPLSYVENGQEIEIKKDDLFSFTFKVDDDDDTPAENNLPENNEN